MMAAKECFFAAEDVAVMQPTERRNSALCRIAEARAYIRRNTRRAEELAKRPRQRPLPLEPYVVQMELFAPAGSAGLIPEGRSPANVTAIA